MMNDYVVPAKAISYLRQFAEAPLLKFPEGHMHDEIWSDAETMMAQTFFEVMGIPFTNNFFTTEQDIEQ
jgi:hypothetical protein